MKSEIAIAICDCCYMNMTGILHKSKNGSPYLFECILCNPAEFELVYEPDKSRRSSDSSNEQGASIQL